MARVVDLKFSRIQFTPDLMPSDITGTDLVQEDATTGRRQMVFAPGPVFVRLRERECRILDPSLDRGQPHCPILAVWLPLGPGTRI